MARVTEEHVEARRNQILAAAWECFARNGYHQTTMQDIATEAGLSAGAIYRYYPSKEGVLRACSDRSQEMSRALVEEARSRAEEPIDALLAIGQTMFSYFYDPMFETATRVDIDIWPEVIRNEELREGRRQELAFWRQEVARLLSEGRARGRLRQEVDPEAATILFICAWEGLRHYMLIDSDVFTPERLIEAMRPMVPEDVALESGRFGQEPTLGRPPFLSTTPRPRPRKKDSPDARMDS